MNVKIAPISHRLRTPPAVVAAIPAPPFEILPRLNQPIGTPLFRWHRLTLFRNDDVPHAAAHAPFEHLPVA